MGCICIDQALSIVFRKLGSIVGKYPGYFIIIPFFLACILATGLQRLHYEDDPEYLFSPMNGRSKLERQIIDDYFPINYTKNFNVGRTTHKGRFGRIIITANDNFNNSNILRKTIWTEIVKLDLEIKNLTIKFDDKQFRYEDICAKHEYKCYNNDILDFYDEIKNIEEKKYFLKYPIWINQETMKAYFFPAYLGGVQRDDNNLILSAHGMNLMYFIDVTRKNGDELGHLWEEKFLTFLSRYNNSKISVSRFVSTTLQTELDSNTHSLAPFFSITLGIMLTFSIGTCMMFDWVRSKPWLGLMGCLSAGIAVLGSFGLCVYCGIEMIGINLVAPFLMLGVGMDDSFVLLAAWRRTNPSLSVSKRLSETYAEAAVSITITSLTNFISFMIGIITPFPSVRIFCIYTAASVLFTYVYSITLFGGVMAYFGEIERRNLHGLICMPVLPKSLSEEKGFFFRLLCTGGRNPNDPNNPKDNKEHMMMIFFRDIMAESLNRPIIKLLIITIFLIYLLIGIYGCSVIKEGLDRRKLSRDDSYSIQFYNYEDKYFREYPYRIQIVINETMNYADPEVQKNIDNMLKTFEQSIFVADRSMTESWLHSYLKFLNQDDSFLLLLGLNTSDPLDFNRGLRDIFLHFPLADQFRYDVIFNEDGSEIIASRYIIQTKNILDANMEKEMLIELRRIADSFPFHVTIYHHYFIFFDQFVLVRSISIQTITVAAIVMLGISLIFIPSPSCAIWVAFSIISIEIGVIGYMTLWNVNLDSISMINLIMCIGFSVDFSAHISYAYISCNENKPSDRVKSALYSLGLPIFQGSVSTILGIIALAFAPSYVFVTFFKTVFLVMLFGATHGILLLPVLLSLTDICRSNKPNKLNDNQLESNNNNCNNNKQTIHYISKKLPPPPMSSIQHQQFNNDDLFIFNNINNNDEKFFNGKTIIYKNGDGAIYIPRPSYINYGYTHNNNNTIDDDKIIIDQQLKTTNNRCRNQIIDDNLSTNNNSINSDDYDVMMVEKDLGLGTSAEECSENSWKVSSKCNELKSNNKNETMIINKQPKKLNNNQQYHINDGYLSDTTNKFKNNNNISTASTMMTTPRITSLRISKSNDTIRDDLKKQQPSVIYQNKNNRCNIPLSYNKYYEDSMPTRHRFYQSSSTRSTRNAALRPISSTLQSKQRSDINNEFDYDLHWDSRWSGTTVPKNDG